MNYMEISYIETLLSSWYSTCDKQVFVKSLKNKVKSFHQNKTNLFIRSHDFNSLAHHPPINDFIFSKYLNNWAHFYHLTKTYFGKGGSDLFNIWPGLLSTLKRSYMIFKNSKIHVERVDLKSWQESATYKGHTLQ